MVFQLSFEDFWVFAHKCKTQNNAPSYHPCCDFWTTRGAVAIKATHQKTVTWKQLNSSLDRSVDQKQALQAKMIEEGMQIPVVFNQCCKLAAAPNLQSNRGRKVQYKLSQPSDPQAVLASQDFAQPVGDYLADHDGCTFYHYPQPSSRLRKPLANKQT